MNEQDKIEYAKMVMKDVMVAFLFEQADEVTCASMVQAIVTKMITIHEDNDIRVDFDVKVEIEDDENMVVKMELYGEDGDAIKIFARYDECPSTSIGEDVFKPKEDVSVAFDRAMKVI